MSCTEIIKDRLFREFKVDAAAGRPQIAYREALGLLPRVRVNSSVSGGKGNTGMPALKLNRLNEGRIEIEDKTVGGVIPKEFIKLLGRHP